MPIGPWELLIILFFVILFFGARKLPEMGRALGIGMRGFKEGISPGDRENSEDDRPDRGLDSPAEVDAEARRSESRVAP